MVDVAVSAQLQQWAFAKPSPTDTSVPAPELYNGDNETLRIEADPLETSTSTDMESKETLSFQQRYLSSEEDLSPMEGNSDNDNEEGNDDQDQNSDSDALSDADDVSIHEANKENFFHARKMSISRFDKGKSCDRAVIVSFVSAGRAKVINLANMGSGASPSVSPSASPSASPGRERQRSPTQRSASLAQLPITEINTKLQKAEEASRMSMSVNLTSSVPRSASPASTVESRRPSTSHPHFSHNNSSLHISDSSSFTTRSSSTSIHEAPLRPLSSLANLQPRSSLRISSHLRPNRASSLQPFPPLTPQSPEPHSFLSTDPYETSTTTAASPIIKQSPHKRLRSISQKLSLAKIAITPSTKKWDSRINGKPSMPPTPATPYSPMTPQTAPVTSSGFAAAFSSPKNRLRRNSRISLSRPGSVRGPSPEVPPVPALVQDQSPRKPVQKLVARGANERAPILELPPCPDDAVNNTPRPITPIVDPVSSIKSRRVRKRKSLMDLL